VPLHSARLAGAVDAVFDSVSVGTTFRKELAEAGVIFLNVWRCEHPNSCASTSARSCRPAIIISPR
jgi:Fe-S cluster assembly scaffold protein SufB